MKLIIASNNKHKVYEIKAILGDKFDEIVSLREAGISHETVEDGTTFLENAVKKAREISDISGACAIADDSGICVDALDGAPGIYSARFASVSDGNASDAENNALLIKKLEGVSDRGAHYTAAVAIAYPNGEIRTAEGHLYGKIGYEPKGERGFGYDPYFIPDGYTRTVAELTDDEKNSISHRGKALRELLLKL